MVIKLARSPRCCFAKAQCLEHCQCVAKDSNMTPARKRTVQDNEQSKQAIEEARQIGKAETDSRVDQLMEQLAKHSPRSEQLESEATPFV